MAAQELDSRFSHVRGDPGSVTCFSKTKAATHASLAGQRWEWAWGVIKRRKTLECVGGKAHKCKIDAFDTLGGNGRSTAQKRRDGMI